MKNGEKSAVVDSLTIEYRDDSIAIIQADGVELGVGHIDLFSALDQDVVDMATATAAEKRAIRKAKRQAKRALKKGDPSGALDAMDDMMGSFGL